MKKAHISKFAGLFIVVALIGAFTLLPTDKADAATNYRLYRYGTISNPYISGCQANYTVGFYSDGRMWAIAKANNPACTVNISIQYTPAQGGIDLVTSSWGNTAGTVTRYAVRNYTKAYVSLGACAWGFGCSYANTVAMAYPTGTSYA